MDRRGKRGKAPWGLLLFVLACESRASVPQVADAEQPDAAGAVQRDAQVRAEDAAPARAANDAAPALDATTLDDPALADAATADAATSVDAATPEGIPTLFFLDVVGARVVTVRPDDKKPRTLVGNQRGTPDGVAADVSGGRLYWTNMGVPAGDDGTLTSSTLDGSDVKNIVPSGGTFTPKQLAIADGWLYWSDREGMHVMRCKLDGSQLQTLVDTSASSTRSAEAKWAVGIAVDPAGFVYWTQKGPDNGGQGSLRRAPIASSEDPAKRTDIEVLFEALPEPIDLALDLGARKLYWTDRGDNTVNRAPMDLPAGTTATTRKDREVLVKGLNEAIGITLDLRRGDLYYTDLGGHVGTSKLDGSGARSLLSGQGTLTGITFVELAK